MKIRDKYLLKNIGVLTIGNFSSKILGFLLVPLYTDILQTSEVGEYDLIVSFISLLFPILTVNISDGVMRFLMDPENKKSDVMVVGMKFLVVGLGTGFFLLFSLCAITDIKVVKEYFVLIILFCFAYFFNNFMIQVSKGLERVNDISIAGVVGTLISFISCFLFLKVFKTGIKGFFYVGILGELVPAIYLFVRSKLWTFLINSKLNSPLQQKMLIYSAPLIATAVGWWINSASDKYVVSLLCDVSVCGLLAVSYRIPSIINTLQGIFIQAWQISAVKEYGTKDTSLFFGKTFEIVNVLICAACSWLIILSKPVGFILFKKDFFDAWQFAPFLLISCVLNSAAGLLGPILSAKKASKPMALSAIFGALTNIILNIILVISIGVQGATIATAIASFVIYFVRKRAVGKDIYVKRYSIVLITWILLCVQAVLEIYTPFWWIEALLMALMVIINWSTIKEIRIFGASLLVK